jgi:hypothetical protein
MIIGEGPGIDLAQSSFYLCDIQFHGPCFWRVEPSRDNNRRRLSKYCDQNFRPNSRTFAYNRVNAPTVHTDRGLRL